ncbi:uncharacterized protein LOC127752112, partial [Frankliniella occidentalis]|uniref:Uncharacterized protein LOC127752112 n=1 Tax=Frankliniella occidentalis TaxID=133901 RepID=A0A9C6XCN3_FRAOC
GDESESDSATELEDEPGSGDEDILFPSLGEIDFVQDEDGEQAAEPADADVCEQCLAIKHGVQFSGVVYVPCAAHTLQLAVDEAVNVPAVQSAIKRAQRLAKKLRTHHYSVQVKRKGFTKAVLSNDTRWGSTYAMMESLIKLQPAIEEICEEEEAAKAALAASKKRKKTDKKNKKKSKTGKSKKNSKTDEHTENSKGNEGKRKKKERALPNLSPYQWRQIVAYCTALEPAAMTTKKLQAADLTA